jgi:hypothetical protein
VLGDQVKKTEVGRTCSTYGGEERCIQGLVGKPEGHHVEDPGVDGKIILNWIFERLDGDS